MRFSTRTEYGLRAMVQLAENYGRHPLSLAKISKKEKISQPYLERLIAKLKKDKLVESTKGVKGGYRLAKAPNKISLLEIVWALEGPIAVFYCLADNTKIVCTRKSCLTRKVWVRLQEEIVKVLKEIKLAELI